MCAPSAWTARAVENTEVLTGLSLVGHNSFSTQSSSEKEFEVNGGGGGGGQLPTEA